MRVGWLNAGEMFWFPSANGGATLVVNDGFTPGARGLYEISVGADGAVGPPRKLFAHGDEFPTSSGVAALDAGRYAVATLTFPGVDSDRLTMTLRAVQREAPEGAEPAIETLYTEEQPYLGGYEPAYLSALADGGAVDVAWTRPSDGGSVVVRHLEASAGVWQATRSVERALPSDVLPLSGDCLLWGGRDGSRVLRVGFESFSTLAIDPQGQAEDEFLTTYDVPLYAWGDTMLALRYGEEDPESGASLVSYVLVGRDGTEFADEPGGYAQASLEPYTALAYADGVLLAPLSDDPAFPTIDVAFRSPSVGLTKVASVARPGDDQLYSVRAFGHEGQVYLAWTSIHESQLDLWVAVAPLEGLP
jgi:hypothetical protein